MSFGISNLLICENLLFSRLCVLNRIMRINVICRFRFLSLIFYLLGDCIWLFGLF